MAGGIGLHRGMDLGSEGWASRKGTDHNPLFLSAPSRMTSIGCFENETIAKLVSLMDGL